jgi:tetratricopeptide (TPR) repeat protein
MRVTFGKSRVRESRMPGSVRAKAEWLSYSTVTLGLRPNLAEVQFNLANALQRSKRYEEAVSHYRRAVALRPDLAPAFVNLGRPLSSLGRWREAIELCKKCLLCTPPRSMRGGNENRRARFRSDQHAQSRWMANARRRPHRSAD